MAKPRPPILRHAQMDLTATVEGQFSPEDWERILDRAEKEIGVYLDEHPGASELVAWQETIRAFHHSHFWGFRADYRPKKIKAPPNLGIRLIWMAFNTLTTMKVAVLWFGQIYSRSDEAQDKWIFFILLVLIVGNFAFFLWRHQSHPD